MNLENKEVLVFGLARSGLAAIKLLTKCHADITLCQNADPKELKEYDQLCELGVHFAEQKIETFRHPYSLCVKNPGIPYRSAFMDALKENGVPVITEIELGFCLGKPQHYFAITGTNGKTTTTTLLYNILSKAYGTKAHVCGNIGTPLCDVILSENLMEEEGHYIALEMSNFQLVNIDTFKPECATIINLTPDHLDFMGSLEEYYRSKTLIYKNMDAQDTFICNDDDESVLQYIRKYPNHAKLSHFSINHDAFNGRILNGWININGENIMPVSEIRIVGRHNLQNIMVAIMMARVANVEKDIIRDVVSQFNGVEHRIEFVRELDGIRYYNDSKGTNTDATITALKAFDHGVILLVGGFEKGLPMDELKRHLGCVKEVIGYGACGPRLIKELTDNKGILVENLQQALNEANRLAISGDTVLLSPTTSSFDQYSCFEERGEHFKKLVRGL